MNQLQIGLREEKRCFSLGEEIGGAVLWEMERAPAKAELRLLWFTRGKGTEDIAVVEIVRFEAPQLGDTRPFSLRAPEAPYSFSGKLISLLWALELVLEPGGHCERVELTIAPGGEEIELPQPVKSLR
ncbi:MAG TPA: hypothetical protein VF593_09385 [Chthoniobacteraceae bacterium]|jgi:hypothetical protein